MIVGIDPGQTGALALLTDKGDLLDAIDMPAADKQVVPRLIANQLWTWKASGPIKQVVVERVGAMPKQGGASTFKFGMSYGIAIGASCLYPQAFITPAKWKKRHKLTGKDKDAARLLALQKWPDKSDLFAQKAKGQARADAALLALAWAEGDG